jgi:CBS domain-containing protein
MRIDLPVVSENQKLLDASVVLLREEVDLLPVTSMDGSGRVVGVMTPLDVILKVIEPLSSESSRREPPDERRLA